MRGQGIAGVLGVSLGAILLAGNLAAIRGMVALVLIHIVGTCGAGTKKFMIMECDMGHMSIGMPVRMAAPLPTLGVVILPVVNDQGLVQAETHYHR